MTSRNISLLLITFLLLAACEPPVEDNFNEYVFVESYLIADRPLDEVRINTTTSTNEKFNFFDAAITDANVQIVLLDENGEDEAVFEYVPSERDGIYLPVLPPHFVIPKRTYRLDVDFNNRQEVITAVTTVPDQIEISREIPDTLIYQAYERLEINLSPHQKVHDQNVYVLSAIAQQPYIENLTPFYRSIINDDEQDDQISDFSVNSTGLINEGNFIENEDGTITFRFPWLGVAFFEGNLIVANLIDSNLHDIARSQQAQLGGDVTFTPGEIHNLIYNMDGGIGVFGSMSTDTIHTYFQRPD